VAFKLPKLAVEPDHAGAGRTRGNRHEAVVTERPGVNHGDGDRIGHLGDGIGSHQLVSDTVGNNDRTADRKGISKPLNGKSRNIKPGIEVYRSEPANGIPRIGSHVGPCVENQLDQARIGTA
ncbi:MAG: hypothetical protein EBU88_18480, partial [Acidobacteria bacterium]|nr:hypothetical protein [Acidobacteriota bacterium]